MDGAACRSHRGSSAAPDSRYPVLRDMKLSKKIYVGNLPFSATESEIESLFAQHGEVVSVNLITDRETGRPRGFGFIEMDEEGAEVAIRELAGHEMDGRALNVNEARERRSGGGQRGDPRRR